MAPKPVPKPWVVGNIDLNNRPRVKNADGSVSTVRSFSYGLPNGMEVLIPSVSNEGKVLSNDEAIKYWGDKGQHLGVFQDWPSADQYAQHLHEDQARNLEAPDLGTMAPPTDYRGMNNLINPPIDKATKDQGGLWSRTPNLDEKATNFLNAFMFGDSKEGQQKAEGIVNAAQFTPYGMASGAYNAGADLGQSKWGHAFLDAITSLPGPDHAAAGFLASIAPAFLPKRSLLNEFPTLHGTKHDFAPVGNQPFGAFDPAKALSGEGTNFEGAGTYLTDKTAVPIAISYAHMGQDTGQIEIGGKNLEHIYNEIKKDPNIVVADLKDSVLKELEFGLDNLGTETKLPHINSAIDDALHNFNEAANYIPTFEHIPSIKPEDAKQVMDFIESFRNKSVYVKQPGGNLYDVLVHSNPDSFINMHMPLVHQDPKIQQGVQEWITHMPLSKHQDWHDIPTIGNGAFGNPRDVLRRTLEDPHIVPYKVMQPILGNEHSVEQANILKDFVPGQKWFSRYDNGAQRRTDVHKLFSELADANKYAADPSDGTRAVLEQQLKKNQEWLDNMPITAENMGKIDLIQATINRMNWKLSQMPTNDDIEAKLWATYHNAPYNYVVNDPQNLTTITGKEFVPK